MIEPSNGDDFPLQLGRQREARLEDALDGDDLAPDVGRFDARLTQSRKLVSFHEVVVSKGTDVW